MTPEKAHFQENLGLNQNTPEQLEKLKNDLKVKVDTLKADGSFSGEDLADLVDLLDDKTILSPTEAELKSHLESLQNLETQIDFLMVLVDIGGESDKSGIENGTDKDLNKNESISENKINDKILEKLFNGEEVEGFSLEGNLTENIKEFLSDINEQNFDKIDNNDKFTAIFTLGILIHENILKISDDVFKGIFKNNFFKDAFKNNEEDIINFFSHFSVYFEERGILDEIINNIGIGKNIILNNKDFLSFKNQKNLDSNNIDISNISIDDLEDKNKKNIILEYFKFNDYNSGYPFYHIKNYNALKILYEEVNNIDEIKNNVDVKESIIDGISKNINIKYEDKIKIPGVKEKISKNLYLDMGSYDSSKNPENELKNIFNIENKENKENKENIDNRYKNLFNISDPRNLINAIDSIFINKEFFDKELFAKYVNPNALDLDSLKKINELYSKDLNPLLKTGNNIHKDILLKINNNTIDLIKNSIENGNVETLEEFKKLIGYENNLFSESIINVLFNDDKNFKEKYFPKEKNRYGTTEFSQENLDKVLSDKGGEVELSDGTKFIDKGSNLLTLKIEFGNNITEKIVKENKELKNFIIEQIVNDPEQILTYDFLNKDLDLAMNIIEKNPEIIKYLSKNIKENTNFIGKFLFLKNTNELSQYLIFNKENLLNLLQLSSKHKGVEEGLINLLNTNDIILLQKGKEIRWILEEIKEESNNSYIGNEAKKLMISIDQKTYENQLNETKNKKLDKNDSKIKSKIDLLKLDEEDRISVENFLEDPNNNENFTEMVSRLGKDKEKVLEVLEILKEVEIDKASKKIDEIEKRINLLINNTEIPENFKKYIINGEFDEKRLFKDFSEWSSKPENFKNNHEEIKDPNSGKIQVLDKAGINFLKTLGIEENHELYKNLEDLLYQEDKKSNLQQIDAKSLFNHFNNGGTLDSYIKEIKQEKLNSTEKNSNSQETQNNSINSSEIISSGQYTLDTSNSVIKTESGKNISLSQEEINMIQKNPDTMKNIINLYESLERVGLTKLWNYKEDIFKSLENVFRVQFDRKDGNYLDERETKILLNAVLTSLGEKPIRTDKKIDNFLSEVENINGRQVTGTEKEVNKLGESRLEASFIEKFVGRGDMIGFKQSAFEDSLKKIN